MPGYGPVQVGVRFSLPGRVLVSVVVWRRACNGSRSGYLTTTTTTRLQQPVALRGGGL
jgi:hypothetical protein